MRSPRPSNNSLKKRIPEFFLSKNKPPANEVSPNKLQNKISSDVVKTRFNSPSFKLLPPKSKQLEENQKTTLYVPKCISPKL